MSPRRILLTQLRRIGDVLMTTAAVRQVSRAYPDARISYLTEPPSDQIFRHNPHVNEVLAVQSRAGSRMMALATLRTRRFDLAVDFFSNPTSALLVRVSGAPMRIGFGFPGRSWAYTHTIAPPRGLTYAAADKMSLLAPLGVPEQHGADLLPEVFLAPEHRRYAETALAGLGVQVQDLLVALCPASRQPYKIWPARHFARLADWMIERHRARVLMISGPGEEGLVDAVRLEMRQRALPDLPASSLLEMAALLQRCHLFVGNDGGARHFAIAVGTPTVAVFGRPFPESWTPPGMAWHRTASYDPGCKNACTYPRCSHLNCINLVPYDEVQAHTEALLADVLKDGVLKDGVLKDGRPARRGPVA
ncbi:MAG: glycosyltransferase family 9 protein [SAR324 cluster bacterium]